MPLGVLVKHHKPLLPRENRMIAAHAAVLAGEPVRAALAEDDVAWHDELGGRFFGAEAFSGATGGGTGATFRAVGGVAGLGDGRVEGEEGEKGGQGGGTVVVLSPGEEGGKGEGGGREAGEGHCGGGEDMVFRTMGNCRMICSTG